MGGGGGTESFVGGRQAVTILTRSTWWLGGIFLALSLILTVMSAGRSTATSDVERLLQQQQQQAPVPGSPLPLGGTEPAPAAETPAAPQPQPQP
jgi:preprotein translocase subunit SecG